MSFSERFITVFKSLLPSPFTIALLLTVVSYFIAMMATEVPEADINFIERNYRSGDTITLHTTSPEAIHWSTGATTPEIKIVPLSDTTITLKIAEKQGEYTNQAAVHISETNGAFSISQTDLSGESKYLQSLLSLIHI